MSQIENTFPTARKNIYSLVTILVAAIAIGLAGTINTFIAFTVAVITFLLVMIFILKWTNLIVVFVTFIVYTNTAVIMIRFHGLPAFIGYTLPLMLLIPFVWQVIVNKQELKINLVFILMLVYFSIMAIGSALSRDIILALPRLINYIIEGLGLYFLLINTIRTPNLLKQIVWLLLIGGALIGALCLYQQVTKTYDNNYWGYAQGADEGFVTGETNQAVVIQPRVSGPIGESNRFAQIMLMLIPLGLFLAWGEPSVKLRLAALILTGLIFGGGSLAFSRGGQIGFLLLIAIMIIMRYIKVHQLIIILLGILSLLLAFPQNNERFISLADIFSSSDEGGLRNADGSIQGRATEMLSATLVFMDHPIIGVGPGILSYEMEKYAKIISLKNITTVREAHSLYLGVAAETGILGFITLMGIFLYTLYRLLKARTYWLDRNHVGMANLCTGFFLAVICYMTTGIFLHTAYIRYLWLMMALAFIASQFTETDFIDTSANQNPKFP